MRLSDIQFPSGEWSAFGSLKNARVGLNDAVSGTFWLAKELAFERLLRRGAAAQSDERSEAPPALEVNGSREKFLAAPGIATDQDGAFRISGLGQSFQHLLKPG